MRLISIVLICFVLAGCAAPQHSDWKPQPRTMPEPDERGSSKWLTYNKPKTPPACLDELYLQLKKVPLDQMTEREYEYFMQKDKECAEAQRAEAELDTRKAQTRSVNEAWVSVAFVGLLGTVVWAIAASD